MISANLCHAIFGKVIFKKRQKDLLLFNYHQKIHPESPSSILFEVDLPINRELCGISFGKPAQFLILKKEVMSEVVCFKRDEKESSKIACRISVKF